MISLGKIITLCRVASSLSQAELARKADITPSYLSLIEKGKRNPSLKLLRRISAVCGVPLPLLMVDENDTTDASKQLKFALAGVLIGKLEEGCS